MEILNCISRCSFQGGKKRKAILDLIDIRAEIIDLFL